VEDSFSGRDKEKKDEGIVIPVNNGYSLNVARRGWPVES